MKFVLLRNKTVISTCGLSVEFIKGVPTYVPPPMYREVTAIGAMPEEGQKDLEAPAPVEDGEPGDPEVRTKAIYAAFTILVERGARDDFTAAGVPHPKAMAKELGWKIDARERDAAWHEFTLKEEA